MNITIKSIEDLKLNDTQNKIINLFIRKSSCYTINELSKEIGVILPTTAKEIRKLHVRKLFKIEEELISIDEFGEKIINFYKFKIDILTQFCNYNKFSKEELDNFIKNDKYNNLNLLLGIKNLLKKETI